MKTPASTPISPVLLLSFLAAALASSPVATDARSPYSFQRPALLLPQFYGTFFSPSLVKSQAQRNPFPLHTRDRLHALTRFHRRGSFMSPLERSLIVRFGTEFRFNHLPSLETKPPHVEKPDPTLRLIRQKWNLSNRNLPAWYALPPECLNVLPLKAYPQRKQKVYPYPLSRRLFKAPNSNRAPPPPAALTAPVICDMALIGKGWSGMELK